MLARTWTLVIDMCGFVGGNQPEWHYDKATQALQHRGPDDQCVVESSDVTLGFARLAVVDLSHEARQPMFGLQDRRIRLVFNGEIYGCQKLRQQLVDAGFRFRSTSDTEVILNAYLRWGPEFVSRIDGMFAIVIHDERLQRIFLYRDRVGIKPLYYYFDAGRFAFGSELQAIETLCDDCNFTADMTACYDFVTYGYVPSPKSGLRNVSRLSPGCRLTFCLRRRRIMAVDRYWQLDAAVDQSQTLSEASDAVRSLIGESVAEQLVADVPVGCFLSGGIDSSIVTAEASVAMRGLQTFAVGFDDSRHSEARFAEKVAAQFQTQHRETTFTKQPAQQQRAALRRMYQEPFADTSAFPTSQVSLLARQSVTVALSGDGGDELFGGYSWYRRYAQLLRYGATRLPGPAAWMESLHTRQSSGTLRRKLTGLASAACADPISLYGRLLGSPPLAERRRWAQELGIPHDYDDFWYWRQYWRKDLPVRTRLQYLDFHTYLPDDILTKVDRASMAHSLEVRVPFLKRELIEFAFSLPEHLRYANNQSKGLLKHAYRHLLPADILTRPKKGFSIPPVHLSEHEGGIRQAILTDFISGRDDADCLPVRFSDTVAKGQQYSGDAHVPGVCQRRA